MHSARSREDLIRPIQIESSIEVDAPIKNNRGVLVGVVAVLLLSSGCDFDSPDVPRQRKCSISKSLDIESENPMGLTVDPNRCSRKSL